MKFFEKILIATAIAFAPLPALAQNSTPAFNDIFTDNAVFADNSEVILRGTAPASTKLTIEIDGLKSILVSNPQGEWEFPINTKGKNQISAISVLDETGQGQTIKNISTGKVFLCSGQSNMEFKLKYSTNAEWEILTSGNSNVWFINIPREAAIEPKAGYNNKPKWQKADIPNVGETSALCYYAAREIAKRKNIKVGIINAAWGGSRIEPWFKRENIASLGGFENELNLLDEFKKSPQIAHDEFEKRQLAAWNDIDIGTKSKWQNPQTEINDWQDINTANSWEESEISELKGFDGVVWFQKSFEIEKIDAKEAIIKLGKIDDFDEVYINGQKVGSTDSWNIMREYKFPTSLLKPKENRLSVRVIDTGGGGGFWGNTSKTITFDNKEIELGNIFKFKIGGELDRNRIKRIVPWGETNGITTLYNGMIAPIKDYSISAFLWYQGESNVGEAKSYEKLLTAFIDQQRHQFKNPTLPFIMSGLSSYGKMDNGNNPSEWAKLRDAQMKIARTIEHVYMAPSLDVGDTNDIHPTQKRIIAKRMADEIENQLFGTSNPTGPFPINAKRIGTEIVISFAETGGGLRTASTDYAIGFAACNKDGKDCKSLVGNIAGDTIHFDGASQNHQIIRYSWSDAPIVNLYGFNGFSLSSFEMMIDGN